jgi:hypothetical protein
MEAASWDAATEGGVGCRRRCRCGRQRIDIGVEASVAARGGVGRIGAWRHSHRVERVGKKLGVREESEAVGGWMCIIPAAAKPTKAAWWPTGLPTSLIHTDGVASWVILQFF